MLAAPFIPICEFCRLRHAKATYSPLFPSALFIFGWTSPPYVMPGGGNWVGPCISGVPFGFGSAYSFLIPVQMSHRRSYFTFRTVVIVYFSANAFLIDAFPGYVASALAAKTVIRSGSGAAMPLFITAMYHNLGNGWAASVWAFISLAMVRFLLSPYMPRLITDRSFSIRSLYHSSSTGMVRKYVRGPRGLLLHKRVALHFGWGVVFLRDRCFYFLFCQSSCSCSCCS